MTEGPITRTATWDEVKVGDIVANPDGSTWRVKAKGGDGAVTLSELAGPRVGTVIPSSPSVEVLLTHEEILEREDVVARTIDALLNGEVVADKVGDEPWKVAESYPDPGSLRSHAWLMHGMPMSTEHDLLSQLEEEHHTWHMAAEAPTETNKGYKEHVHTEEFIERARPTLVEMDQAIEVANTHDLP